MGTPLAARLPQGGGVPDLEVGGDGLWSGVEADVVAQETALALSDAFGSTEKTMHLNPGGHVQVPKFERDANEAFFRRHLLGTR